MSRYKITGVVLAGGKSSRLGTDKALVLIKGRPLISYAIETLSCVCHKVVINSGQPVYSFTGCEIWPDLLPIQAPIIGIYSCLKRSDSDWNIFLSCDMPMVDHRLFDLLLSQRDGVDAVVPFHQDGMEPLCSTFSRRVLPFLEERIANGQYGIQQFVRQARSRLVKISPELDFYSPKLFTNLNTAEDIRFFSLE